MNNQEAVKFIQGKAKTLSKPRKLAAMWVMEDIVSTDVDEWVDTPIHESLKYFIDAGRHVLDKRMEKLAVSDVERRTFVNGAIGIAESMYHYAEMHHELREEYTSER